jgi:hypothetical protein
MQLPSTLFLGRSKQEKKVMNAETAIKAHVQWKAKLRAYLQAPNKSLNPVEIEKDNNCELGKWLHGEGARHAGKQTYKDLVVEHAKFHKAAADVVRRADSGKKVLEETILGNSSTFSSVSGRVVELIIACGRECL